MNPTPANPAARFPWSPAPTANATATQNHHDQNSFRPSPSQPNCPFSLRMQTHKGKLHAKIQKGEGTIRSTRGTRGTRKAAFLVPLVPLVVPFPFFRRVSWRG